MNSLALLDDVLDALNPAMLVLVGLGLCNGCPSSIAATLAAPGMHLFIESPSCALPLTGLLPVAGWVLGEQAYSCATLEDARTVRLMPADGKCECAYDVRRDANGRLSAPAPSNHGPSSGGPRAFHLSDQRRLLRIVAPESATPGINWALGLDALRVLESSDAASLDWLISIDAEEEEDIKERIICGVQGESFRRDRRPSLLRVERVDCGPGTALVLPECCRVAATTPGALPADAELLWRVAPFQRGATLMERCIGGSINRPFWVTASSAADARMLACTLPAGCVWAAHVCGPTPPSARDIEALREAGCGGVCIAWSDEICAAWATRMSGAFSEVSDTDRTGHGTSDT